MPKVYIEPKYDDPDKGDGGIRRVVEAQKRYLPEFGWEIAANKEEADLIALHAGLWIKNVPRSVPIVSHSHGLYWDGYEWQKWHHQLNEQVIYSILHADAVTAPSEWVANALRRNFGVRPTTLYHGIEPSDWNSGAAKNGNYVLWNKARVDAICDPAPVLELARRVQSLEFVTTFASAGGDADVPPNVKVTGLVHYEEAKKYVEGAAIYLATTRETFGVGTLEAMASGVPILGWDYAGQREIVQHKVTGWLAPRGDYDSLEEGLIWCLANRDQLRSVTRRTVESTWSWRDAIQRYADLYQETLRLKKLENSSPRTSIIVTNYNLGRYLPETIDSILEQSDQDFEVILVDDASTNSDEYLITTYQRDRDARIKLVEHTENVYLAESLNDGVRRARGRYILPLDADNMISPGTLENLANRLDADRDADIAYGSVEFIEPTGQRFISSWPPAKFDLRSQLSHKNQIPSTSLYRKQIWERVGGYRARCKTAEDADFWCRVTSFGAKPVKATDAVTLIYRNREDSMSHTQSDWPWEIWYPWGSVGYERLAPPASGLQLPHAKVLAAESPIVSIVIPVGPKHTRIVFDALDSIRAQTFQGWEVIVVNDTDDLSALYDLPSWCKFVEAGYKDGPRGPARARNKGMQFAGGKYFLFLDADDFLEPTALEKMVGAIHGLPEKSFVYGDWVHVGNKKRVNSQEWDCAGLLRQLSYPVTALYPIEAWKASGGFDEEYTVAWEDWDFAIRIANAGYCGVRIPEVLLHYRMDTGTRREEGFARKEELKLVVFDKWKDYIQGDKKLMACGSCGQRALPRSYSASPESSSPPEGAVLMQYNGDSQQVLVFRGLGTNRNYRFGLDPDHRTRYVDPTDVPGFLTLGFTVVNDAEPAFV